MSFASILRRIVEGCSGCLVAILIESDGIPIEQAEGSPLTAEERERISHASVELVRVLEEIRKASDSFAGGSADELVVGLERYWFVVRPVDPETRLVVVLAPDGNLGKARFLVRRHLADLQAQL